MHTLSDIYIKETLADSPLIYERGRQTWKNGSWFISAKDMAAKQFVYQFNGSYGNYTTQIRISEKDIQSQCSCPFPGSGCRHVVAAVLNARSLLVSPSTQNELFQDADTPYLTPEEIRSQALNDRQERSRTDNFTPIRGDMFTGDHKVVSKEARTYIVCFHNPIRAMGHCSCPDYQTNGLGTCKHLLFMARHLKKEPGFRARAEAEVLPFIDIYWDSLAQAPKLHACRLDQEMADLKPVLGKYFDAKGRFIAPDISLIMGLMLRLHGDRRVKIRENLLTRVEHRQQVLLLEKLQNRPRPKIPLLRPLYPFQEEGIHFGLLKTGVLIGDEMGLGKSIQAIGLSLMKKEVFGFSKILVITLPSLKALWQQEIQEATRESACIITGSPSRRQDLYRKKDTFKICHYETVLKDVAALSGYNPDIIILDEAQRIRDLSTKTAEAVKRLPKKHAIVLTGSPLENKPADLYSIVQFLDPYLFTPLWKFAADHFNIPRDQKFVPTRIKEYQSDKALYKNLDLLKEKLSHILIRRTWQDVGDQLPDWIFSPYSIQLAPEQLKRHNRDGARLAELIRKKNLTPMDLRQVQTLVLQMRMVCNSTFLVDRETQVSPKLRELSAIVDEVVVQNHRKMVIFSEWTAMTFLIARHLSESNVDFLQVSGKVSAQDRQAIAREFSRPGSAPIFLTTDAGSQGLDLSTAHCMVNVELPWTPGRMEGRQACLRPPQGEHDLPCCHIIHLVSQNSIEEQIMEGLSREPDLFTGLFDSDPKQMEALCRDPEHLGQKIRALLGPKILDQPPKGPRDIPDDSPYLLFSGPNPARPGHLDQDPDSNQDLDLDSLLTGETDPEEAQPPAPSQAFSDPRQLEAILNSGIDFMAGLAALAAGQKKAPIEDKMITMDPETGRITLSFTLPGKGSKPE